MNMDDLKAIAVAKDKELAHRVERLFPNAHVRVRWERSLDRALERFETETFDVLLVTSAAFAAGEMRGVEAVEIIASQSPVTQILFLADPKDIGDAMSAMKAGSYQYARFPIGDEELRLLIETAIAKRPQYGTNLLRETGKREAKFEKLVGKSRPMQDVYRQIRQASATDMPVLLSGETGTGKDLAAQAIHQQSDRSGGPYIPVNLGSLPPELVASELFGHEKGAFTGASDRQIGTFEQAHDGTIFLDEISTVDEKVQVTLLRLMEQKKFRRLGGRRSRPNNARIVTATNQDLMESVQRGTFRQDLFYRLEVFHIALPPLRERQGDVLLLIEEFLGRYNRAYHKTIEGISPECMNLLEMYDWPGNVRELKNVIQRAALVCTGDVLRTEHLPPRFQTERSVRPKVTFDVGTPLNEVEREMVIRALAVADNNRTQAAQLLAISRRALYNKLRKHGID